MYAHFQAKLSAACISLTSKQLEIKATQLVI